MLKEFKEFILRGNIVDMAVGIVIGLAFGKVVSSFVTDILMPPIGLALGGIDFSNLFINLSSKHYDTLQAAKAAGAPTLNIGLFINSIIDFLIIVFAMFIVISAMNRLMKRFVKEKPAPQPSNEEKLLAEIRDLLKNNESENTKI